MKQERMLFLLVALLIIGSIGFAQSTRIWMRTMPGTLGQQGVGYNPTNARIYYTHFYQKVINIISADSNVTSYGTIPTPNNESACVDIKYCSYDNSFWVLNNWRKTVYKITSTGTIRRSFTVPAVDYGAGLAWDEATRTSYISDRRTAIGSFPQYIHVYDTLGNVIRRMDHPYRVNYGNRGITFRPRSGNLGPWILNSYTFWNSGATAIDSAKVLALDPANARVLNAVKVHLVPETCNIRGVEFDPRGNTFWVMYIQYGT
jgi:DNA-binding beta-propeller fold protein YncE